MQSPKCTSLVGKTTPTAPLQRPTCVVLHRHANPHAKRRRFNAPRTYASTSSKPSPLPINADGFVEAGPRDSPPDYRSIDSQPLNKVVYTLFRRRMVQALGGKDSPLEGYAAIIDLTRRLNAGGSPRDTQIATIGILNSLFPSWLPPAFKVMFARPLKELSCRLNAWATWLTCQWLMGPCEVNDVEIDGGAVGAGHGVLVKRCRYLEEAGCASICINSCKIPTQEFFAKDMGLPLRMTPNYENFECQFAFGATPPPIDNGDAFTTPCFVGCPTAIANNKAKKVTTTACHRIDREAGQ